MTRRLASVFGTVLVCVAAAGCGGESDASELRAAGSAQLETGPTVLMLVGSAPEGSFRACLQSVVRGGRTIESAVQECSALYPVPGNEAREVPDAAQWSGSGGGLDGDGGGSCSQARGRPELSTVPFDKYVRPTKEEQASAAQARVDKATEERKAAERELAEKEAELAEAKKNGDPIALLEEERDQAQAKVEDKKKKEQSTWIDEVGKADRGGYAPPTEPTQQTDPEAQDACSEMAAFIARCNDRDWKDPDCQAFLAKMRNCGDPMREADEPADPGEGCRRESIDAGEALAVAVLACEKLTKPEPGAMPCEPLQGVDASAFRYPWRTSAGGGVCGDTRALTEGEQCVGTFTLVRVANFGERDVQQALDEAREKLGGPVIFLPQPKTGGGPTPGPAPDPER